MCAMRIAMSSGPEWAAEPQAGDGPVHKVAAHEIGTAPWGARLH